MYIFNFQRTTPAGGFPAPLDRRPHPMPQHSPPMMGRAVPAGFSQPSSPFNFGLPVNTSKSDALGMGPLFGNVSRSVGT